MPDAVSSEIHARTHAHIRGSLSFSFPRISSFPTYDYLTSFRDRYSPLYGTAETINREIGQTSLDPPPASSDFIRIFHYLFCIIFNPLRRFFVYSGFSWNFSLPVPGFDLNFEFSLNFFLFDRLQVFSNFISDFRKSLDYFPNKPRRPFVAIIQENSTK